MVRLEGGTYWSNSCRKPRFNSYMVRLEEPIACKNHLRCEVSIPIWCDWKYQGAEIALIMFEFQFLYGAIGSGRGKRFFAQLVIVSIPIWCDWKFRAGRNKRTKTGFNSYMVRLEARWLHRETKESLFQFLYGAIGSCELHRTLRPSFEFQFLYGAIGRPIHRTINILYSSFNSYMVRLEARNRERKKSERKVSIPIWCDWKASWKRILDRRYLFQFLYGAIGRVLRLGCFDFLNLFQFLYGAIGSPLFSKNVAFVTQFQFLYGAIGRMYDERTTIEQRSFNSYMVRLEGSIVRRCMVSITCFNSYMVRLEVEYSEASRWITASFNSYMVRLEAFSPEHPKA